jgi:hypothetical protein
MSGTTRRPTTDELLAAIQEQADADEVDRIAALSDDALDAELRGLGDDPAAVRAKGAAIVARAGKVLADQRPAAPRRIVFQLSALAAAAALALVMADRQDALRNRSGDIRADDDKPAGPSPQERALALRAKAELACANRRWSDCEDALDGAKNLDPAGEATPRVIALRAMEQAGQYPDAGRYLAK